MSSYAKGGNAGFSCDTANNDVDWKGAEIECSASFMFLSEPSLLWEFPLFVRKISKLVPPVRGYE